MHSSRLKIILAIFIVINFCYFLLSKPDIRCVLVVVHLALDAQISKTAQSKWLNCVPIATAEQLYFLVIVRGD
jgi:hypothetical protein